MFSRISGFFGTSVLPGLRGRFDGLASPVHPRLSVNLPGCFRIAGVAQHRWTFSACGHGRPRLVLFSGAWLVNDGLRLHTAGMSAGWCLSLVGRGWWLLSGARCRGPLLRREWDAPSHGRRPRIGFQASPQPILNSTVVVLLLRTLERASKRPRNRSSR